MWFVFFLKEIFTLGKFATDDDVFELRIDLGQILIAQFFA